MKLIDYVLKFGFMFGLSIVLMFYAGPAFIKKIESDQTKVQITDGLLEFRLSNVFNGTDYLQLFILTKSNDTLIKNYYVPDKEYSGIKTFLVENQIVQNKPLSKLLPIVLKKPELTYYKDIKYRLEKNNVELLSINDHYLIGKRTTVFKKVIYYILGGVFGIVGLLAFLLTSIVFFDCIQSYQKTGVLPSLPNSIDSKIQGLKYILRGFM